MINCIAPFEVPHLERDGFELYFFGDRQEGSTGYLPEAWAAFKDEFKRSKCKKAAIGLGDYGDWLRPSLRPAVAGALGKDDSARRMLDKAILKEHDKIIDAHAFLEGYMIGVHEGHHNWTTLDQINLDQRLAAALKTRFLGFTATTRIVLRAAYCGIKAHRGKEGNLDSGRVVTLFSTHGNANGRKVPGALAWVENNLANSLIADIYVVGHGCKSGNDAPNERVEVRRLGPPGVRRSVPRIMAVGGFTRSYTDGWESDYVQRAGMSPQPPGWGVIRFKLVQGINRSLARGFTSRKSKQIDISCINRFYTEQDD